MARSGHGSLWIPQNENRAPAWYKFGKHPSAESCSKLHPGQPSPLPIYLSSRPGARHPLLLPPGLGSSISSPLGALSGRGFPPPTSGGQQPAALGLCAGGCRCRETKPDSGKQRNLGKDPVAWPQDALSTPQVTPNICRGWHTSSLHCSPSLQACRSAGPSSLIGND